MAKPAGRPATIAHTQMFQAKSSRTVAVTTMPTPTIASETGDLANFPALNMAFIRF